MAIDVLAEHLISFRQAAKLLPQGRRPSAATWWRWVHRGLKGCHLEVVYLGGRVCTSTEAVQRFFAAITAKADGAVAMPPSPRVNRGFDQADATLRAAGFRD